MVKTFTSLDPLADYLEPEFGDVYEGWTPELWVVVKNYLTNELNDVAYTALLHALLFDSLVFFGSPATPGRTKLRSSETDTGHWMSLTHHDWLHFRLYPILKR